MTSVCAICDDKLNQTVRKPVCCPYCEFTACRTCCETYILGETTSKCMNPPCNREWTRQFIAKSFTGVFVTKKLKKKREEILFDIERSLLPATQPRVEYLIKNEKLSKEYNELWNNVWRQVWDLQYKQRSLKNAMKVRRTRVSENQWEVNNIATIKKEYDEVNKQLEDLHDKRNELSDKYSADCRRLREEYNFNQPNNSRENEPQQRREFIRACPDNDCRGFLSTQWKCGLCEKWSCPECHEIKGPTRDTEHTCNPDILASARLLSSDTRPCPSCGSGIFKIAGCDHMWCTQCRKGFNWRTGRIEADGHNPHYFEWLRRNGNYVPDNDYNVQNIHNINIPCQHQRLNHMLFRRIHNLLVDKHKDNPMSISCDEFIGDLFHNIVHINNVIVPRYPVNNYRQDRNQDLRIQYMRNKITEDDFKITLQRDEKKYEKNRELRNIFDLLETTVTDIILRFVEHLEQCEPGQWENKIIKEIEQIVSYTNDCFLDISKTYNSKCIIFTNHLREI